MKISVVIPTLNREKELIDTIEKVLEDKYPDFEVIVVDQTEIHRPETADRLSELREKVEIIAEPIKSLPHARNVGVAHSSGEIILFLDDDIIPQPGLISAHAALYEDAKVGGVGGRIVAAGDEGKPEPSRVVTITAWGAFKDYFYATHAEKVATVRGANMSFRRDLYIKLGGFDENYVGNAMREETDFSFRLRKLGYRLVFEPAAEVFHLLTPTGGARSGDRVGRYRTFFRNNTYFFLRHFNPLLLPLFWLTMTKQFLGCVLRFSPIAPFQGAADAFGALARGPKLHADFIR